jgi:hypothetical protein
MFPGSPGSDQILAGSVTATGTLITIPAGMIFSGNLAVAASSAIAGTSTVVVSTAGTNVAPAAGPIARISVTGLLSSAGADSYAIEVVVKAPPENSVTLTAAISGTGSASIIGWYTS